jgi:hypothetical protein
MVGGRQRRLWRKLRRRLWWIWRRTLWGRRSEW